MLIEPSAVGSEKDRLLRQALPGVRPPSDGQHLNRAVGTKLRRYRLASQKIDASSAKRKSHREHANVAAATRDRALKWRTNYFGRRNRHCSGHEHRLAGFSASSGENVAVAVSEVALYPAVLYSRINPPLEIAVPNLEELVPSQKSFDGDIVFREHHEDLPCGVIIGCGAIISIPPMQREP